MGTPYIIQVESNQSARIKRLLKQRKGQTGKSIRRIVTDILLGEEPFLCQKNIESIENKEEAAPVQG